jgi:hypothetical protein
MAEQITDAKAKQAMLEIARELRADRRARRAAASNRERGSTLDGHASVVGHRRERVW